VTIHYVDIYDVPLHLTYRKSSSGNDDYQGTFHSHQGMEIMFVHQGRGTVVVDRKTFDIRPGMLCVFQPYQLHHIQVEFSEASPFVRSFLLFEPALYDAYFDPWPELQSFYRHLHLNKLTSPCLYDLDEYSPIVGLLQELSEQGSSLSDKDQFPEHALSVVIFYRYLKRIWQSRASQPEPAAPRGKHQAEVILNWLHQHYREPLRLEHMARDLHLSPFHLSHLFKEAIGVSISEYVAAKRIHQAVVLLTTGNLTLTQIGNEIGIANCSYFCKFFKTHMGITPHQYRKKWQQSDAISARPMETASSRELRDEAVGIKAGAAGPSGLEQILLPPVDHSYIPTNS